MRRKNSLGLFSGLALGLATVYALSLYFGLTWNELKGFMISTGLLLGAMLVVAAVLVGIIKLTGILLRKLRGNADHDSNDDQE